jgi:hypothetical protein
MKSRARKRILVIITNGFAAMNVIHSGLMAILCKEYEIHILTDLMDDRLHEEINNQFQMDTRIFRTKIPKERAVLKWLRKLEKAVFFKYFEIETQHIKNKSQYGFFRHAVIFALNLLTFLNVCLPLLLALRKRIIATSVVPDLAESISSGKFSGIISTSPLDIRENIIINSQKNKIATLAMVISWDNLTTKGLINADHQYILVWNKLMAAEYAKFYQPFRIKNQKICITGIPRFDAYFEVGRINSTSNFKEKFQFPHTNKVILFATSATKHLPNQADIVSHLLEYSKTRANINVLVRCHPGDDFRQYEHFKKEENIRIWFSERWNSANLNAIPEPDTLLSLEEMLRYSDVCVNIASTIRLDAAACNKPVINVAYDGEMKKPYPESVRSLYDYTHQIPLNRLGIDTMVFSKFEMFSFLDETLFGPEPQPQRGRDLIKDFTHFTEPFSVSEIVRIIGEWQH